MLVALTAEIFRALGDTKITVAAIKAEAGGQYEAYLSK